MCVSSRLDGHLLRRYEKIFEHAQKTFIAHVNCANIFVDYITTLVALQLEYKINLILYYYIFKPISFKSSPKVTLTTIDPLHKATNHSTGSPISLFVVLLPCLLL